ncbi:MAG: SIR2 family protein, partial [Verrucomicrobiota bacterium]
QELGEQILEVVGSSGALNSSQRGLYAQKLKAGKTFEVVERCRRLNPSLVSQILKLRLDKSGRSSLTHELLARIPFRGAVTTNYDTFIESHRNNSKVLLPSDLEQLGDKGLTVLLRDSTDFPVVKMHGSADRPETLLLGRDDYKEWTRDKANYRNFLAALLSQYTAFFYGHSLQDPSVTELLQDVRGDSTAVKHYAVLVNATDEEQDEFKKTLGLETINLEGTDVGRSGRIFLKTFIELTSSGDLKQPGEDSFPPS